MGLHLANIEPSKKAWIGPSLHSLYWIGTLLVVDTSTKGEKLILKTNSVAYYFVVPFLPLHQWHNSEVI